MDVNDNALDSDLDDIPISLPRDKGSSSKRQGSNSDKPAFTNFKLNLPIQKIVTIDDGVNSLESQSNRTESGSHYNSPGQSLRPSTFDIVKTPRCPSSSFKDVRTPRDNNNISSNSNVTNAFSNPPLTSRGLKPPRLHLLNPASASPVLRQHSDSMQDGSSVAEKLSVELVSSAFVIQPIEVQNCKASFDDLSSAIKSRICTSLGVASTEIELLELRRIDSNSCALELYDRIGVFVKSSTFSLTALEDLLSKESTHAQTLTLLTGLQKDYSKAVSEITEHVTSSAQKDIALLAVKDELKVRDKEVEQLKEQLQKCEEQRLLLFRTLHSLRKEFEDIRVQYDPFNSGGGGRGGGEGRTKGLITSSNSFSSNGGGVTGPGGGGGGGGIASAGNSNTSMSNNHHLSHLNTSIPVSSCGALPSSSSSLSNLSSASSSFSASSAAPAAAAAAAMLSSVGSPKAIVPTLSATIVTPSHRSFSTTASKPTTTLASPPPKPAAATWPGLNPVGSGTVHLLNGSGSGSGSGSPSSAGVPKLKLGGGSGDASSGEIAASINGTSSSVISNTGNIFSHLRGSHVGSHGGGGAHMLIDSLESPQATRKREAGGAKGSIVKGGTEPQKTDDGAKNDRREREQEGGGEQEGEEQQRGGKGSATSMVVDALIGDMLGEELSEGRERGRLEGLREGVIAMKEDNEIEREEGEGKGKRVYMSVDQPPPAMSGVLMKGATSFSMQPSSTSIQINQLSLDFTRLQAPHENSEL